MLTQKAFAVFGKKEVLIVGWVVLVIMPLMILFMPLAGVILGFQELGEILTDGFNQIGDFFANLF